uniref:ATPase family AAA domain containing 5 n=1 Tax=Stegastes partitus TaxID=144197 RepID=A0A3B4ZZI8_9TELE
MRNKLKRSKSRTSTTSRSKAQTTGVILLSESRCSDGETTPAAKDKHVSHVVTGFSERHVQSLQEEGNIFCAKYARIAPIFLSRIKQSKSKNISDGDQAVERTQKSVLLPQIDDVQVSQLKCEDESVLSTWRGQLSPSALHSCLEEIQTCNPVFPVQAVFRTLLKLQSGSLAADLVNNCELNSEWTNHAESDTQSLKNSETLQRGRTCHMLISFCILVTSLMVIKFQDFFHFFTLLYADSYFEDVLWTDKYSPQDSSEVVGNSASVKRLHSWLKKWKLRADRDERRKMEERKQVENNSWDCGDFQGEAGAEDGAQEPLWNTMLITGPSGVGKTASVYACAQELGFKVFEVNCSSQRSGRHVLSQLQEASQSHLVEMSGTDPLKPAYFHNYSTNSCTAKSETVPGRTDDRWFSFHCIKAKPATLTLAHYFKMKAKADHLHFSGMSPCEKPDSQKLGDSSPDSTSLILFEEVDVIFDDDVGFLAAIKTFMTTTKRPVILTTNDPRFKERFDCSLEEIIFKTPSAVNVCSHLQLVCLAEKVRLDLDDVCSLLKLSCGDVRRCLLQLQLWVNSGGRRGSHTSSLQNKLLCQHVWPPSCNSKLSAEPPKGKYSYIYITLKRKMHLTSLYPNVSATNSKPVRNISRLSRRKYISTSPSNPSSHKPQKTSSLNGTSSSPSSRDKTVQKATSDCLEALTDFFDLMSYLDATVPTAGKHILSSCTPEGFVWSGAELNDGLLDEMSKEECLSWSQEKLLDIQTAVEGLGCRRCLWRVSEASLHRCKKRNTFLETVDACQTLYIIVKQSAKISVFTLCYTCVCPSSVSQRRYRLSRMVLSSKSFSLLGNRQAVSVDYMPVLRSICRSHRVQQQQGETARCLNYLSNTHLGLSKSAMQLLAEDFN